MKAIVEPIIDATVRQLCCRPYPNHPKGCPNYGKRATCPPTAPLLADVLDLNRPIWAVWVEFDLAAHREKMRAAHPTWTRRQLDCCLYWQAGVNNQLRRKTTELFPDLVTGFDPKEVVSCPEACGVNVTETMASIGIALEWPPVNIIRKVALVGYYTF